MRVELTCAVPVNSTGTDLLASTGPARTVTGKIPVNVPGSSARTTPAVPRTLTRKTDEAASHKPLLTPIAEPDPATHPDHNAR